MHIDPWLEWTYLIRNANGWNISTEKLSTYAPNTSNNRIRLNEHCCRCIVRKQNVDVDDMTKIAPQRCGTRYSEKKRKNGEGPPSSSSIDFGFVWFDALIFFSSRNARSTGTGFDSVRSTIVDSFSCIDTLNLVQQQLSESLVRFWECKRGKNGVWENGVPAKIECDRWQRRMWARPLPPLREFECARKNVFFSENFYPEIFQSGRSYRGIQSMMIGYSLRQSNVDMSNLNWGNRKPISIKIRNIANAQSIEIHGNNLEQCHFFPSAFLLSTDFLINVHDGCLSIQQ